MQIEKEIEKIKKELIKIKDMRPGSLNMQYKDPKRKVGSYYQLNYMYKMKSETKYVRKDQVDRIKKEIEEYKKFKMLTSRTRKTLNPS